MGRRGKGGLTQHRLLSPLGRSPGLLPGWALQFGQNDLKQEGPSTLSSASCPREGSGGAGHSCPPREPPPSQKWGLWHCQESSQQSWVGFERALLGFCRAEGMGANICQQTEHHQIHSSCTLLVTSSLTLLPAQILNPSEARRTGAFHHGKTNTLLILSAAKLQNMTLGCSTNNRGKAALFSLEIPSLLPAVSRLWGPDI